MLTPRETVQQPRNQPDTTQQGGPRVRASYRYKHTESNRTFRLLRGEERTDTTHIRIVTIMQVTISDQHVEVTNRLFEYIRRKLTRINQHFVPVIRDQVALHLTRNDHRLENTTHTKVTQWHATAENKELYAVAERVMDKLDHQPIKHKGRDVDHHQEGGGLKIHPSM